MIGDVPLKRRVGHARPFMFLCFASLELNSLTPRCAPDIMCCFATDLKPPGQLVDHGLEPLKV